MQVVFYKWGSFHGMEELPEADIKDMVQLEYDHLEGFDIRKEDENLEFYAYPECIEEPHEGEEEEGYGIKRAFAISK